MVIRNSHKWREMRADYDSVLKVVHGWRHVPSGIRNSLEGPYCRWATGDVAVQAFLGNWLGA